MMLRLIKNRKSYAINMHSLSAFRLIDCSHSEACGLSFLFFPYFLGIARRAFSFSFLFTFWAWSFMMEA